MAVKAVSEAHNVLGCPSSLSLRSPARAGRGELALDTAEHAVDIPAKDPHSNGGDERDEREQERVLDQVLTLVVTDETLNHDGFPLLFRLFTLRP